MPLYRVQTFALLFMLLLASPAFATDAIAQGQQLFQNNCLGCHQTDAHGPAPALTNTDFLNIASDAFLFDTIKEGRMDAGMPPWGWLGEQKIRALVGYLRTQSTQPNRSHSINGQPVATGDARRGAVLFGNICASCHGINGHGYDNGNTGTHIGNSAFLRVASDGFIREVIKHGRRGTAMRAFSGVKAMAALNDQEINDIIVFLRSLAAKPQGEAS